MTPHSLSVAFACGGRLEAEFEREVRMCVNNGMLRLNQFMVAEAKLTNGQAIPAGLVLWARVSAEVDARLSAAPHYPIRLHPSEWQSGDVFWIVDAAGEQKAVQNCIQALANSAFKGREFKMLRRAGAIRPSDIDTSKEDIDK